MSLTLHGVLEGVEAIVVVVPRGIMHPDRGVSDDLNAIVGRANPFSAAVEIDAEFARPEIAETLVRRSAHSKPYHKGHQYTEANTVHH